MRLEVTRCAYYYKNLARTRFCDIQPGDLLKDCEGIVPYDSVMRNTKRAICLMYNAQRHGLPGKDFAPQAIYIPVSKLARGS